jgi:hypothetical protein
MKEPQMTALAEAPKTDVSFSNMTVEAELKALIQYALTQSRTGNCSTEAALELLDRAWVAQKMLWQLRNSASFSTDVL